MRKNSIWTVWALSACGVLALLTPALANDYAYQGSPLGDEPPEMLSDTNGSPIIFRGGDGLYGSLLPGDVNAQFIRYAGTGNAGLTRYTFDMNMTASYAPNSNPFFAAFDTRGYLLGSNSGFPGKTNGSRVIWDQFGNGGNTTLGLYMSGVNAGDDLDYRVSVTATKTPVWDLSKLSLGTDITVLNHNEAGAADWYSFTLDHRAIVNLSTLGSLTGDGKPFDTMLTLYGEDGKRFGMNDDVDILNGEISSQLMRRLEAGTYYVGLSSYNGRNNNYNFWDRSGMTGGLFDSDYNLNIQVTPEPGTVALLIGLMVSGVGFAARRRRSR